MPQPAPVLVEVRRGEVVESRHRGSLILLDPDGSVGVSAGDPDATIYPRSCLKPLQAAAMLGEGFGGPDESVALACASHDAEAVHVAGVRAILSAAGLDESALQCPPDLPANRAAMTAWLQAGGAPASVCHNCSGKHAAMVATCAASGWPVGPYREPAHPLQVAARATVERLCGEPVRATSVDGCGAPAYAVSLAGLARAYARLATAPEGTSEARVRTAMQAQPHLVGGTGRAVTAFLAGVPGLICKDGAECVWGAALPDGRAFAVKADDGGSRALPALLSAALAHWGIDSPVVAEWAALDVLGGGAPVGAVTWSATLRDLLALPS